MILDMERFVNRARPAWQRLEALLDRIAARPGGSLDLAEAEELRLLYHRAAADLNRLQHGAVAGGLEDHLEALVARAYAEVYARPRRTGWRGRRSVAGFTARFPEVFRRHVGLFWLAFAITVGGAVFGALAVSFDPAAASVLLPADYLRHPAARVAQEQHRQTPIEPAEEAQLAAIVISNNIRVAILALALGVTLGVGTGILLFGNGVMVGAVAAQYARFGFGWFVAGWLLPHGAFEIPSVLIAGQAGFLLAQLMIGGGRAPRRQRLRTALPELLTLLGGLCCLLLWAGMMEGFFSQHHAPVVSYSVKVAVGLAELALLFSYLFAYGRRRVKPESPRAATEPAR